MADLMEVAGGRVGELLPVQHELIGLPAVPAMRAQQIERRQAGRPPGSRNRRMEDAARTAIEAFGDPLLRQVAVATMDAEELAGRVGCTLLEAIQEQRLAAALVLPFLHSRRPLAVDVTSRKMVHLTILDAPAPAEHDDGEIVEVQVVSMDETDGV